MSLCLGWTGQETEIETKKFAVQLIPLSHFHPFVSKLKKNDLSSLPPSCRIAFKMYLHVFVFMHPPLPANSIVPLVGPRFLVSSSEVSTSTPLRSDGYIGGPLEFLRGVCHVAVQMGLAFRRSRDGIDLGATDNAAGDWEYRAGVHKVGVDLSRSLTALVDAPRVICQQTKNETGVRSLKLTKRSKTGRGDSRRLRIRQGGWSCIDPWGS